MSLGMLGKYERLDILGHGASGIVYLAQDTLLRRRVALKEITAQGEDKRRVLEEARVLDRLRHPNIVAVHGVDTINGKVVIDMEYIAGNNLLEIMRQADGPIPINDSLDITVQICEGLAYAHSLRTVHRDIKPANILVSSEHQVKLADFGLAQVLGTNSYAGGAGTFAYMAPEDFEEGDRSDQQSDLWAVGVILYEMLTGRRPFTVVNARDPFAWSRAISKDIVLPPSQYVPDIPSAVDRVCIRALQRNKSDRYQLASEMAADLSKVRSPIADNGRVAIPVQSFHELYETASLSAPALIGASDIDGLLAKAPSHWAEVCEKLANGQLAIWLDLVREPLLARVATELSNESSSSIENRMRDFLYRAGVELDRSAREDARKGGELIAAGIYPAAVELLQRAVNLDPSQPSYFRLLGQAGSGAGDIDLARDALSKGLNRHPLDRALKRDLAQIGGVRPQLSSSYVNFGQLRHGEVRMATVTLRSIGKDSVKGRVASAPGWLKVTPLSFSAKNRQVLKLVAESGTLPREPNDFEEKVVLETTGGMIDLSVSVSLLPTRPSFRTIYHWYLPILAFCLMPAIVAQLATLRSYQDGDGKPLAPAGLIDSGTLFAAFLAVNVIVDTRWRERLTAALGIASLPVGVIYLMSLSSSAPHSMMAVWPIVIETSLPSLAIPLVQAATLVRARETFSVWPLWCFAIAAVSSIVSIVLWRFGVPGVQ